MCGLAALIATSDTRISMRLCERLSGELKHRGPDASGIMLIGRDGAVCAEENAVAALVHRRLAIIDLDSRSDQPMLSSDGRFALIFNGEIYNYIELREELLRKGHVFRTASDSEVLMSAVTEWGDGALTRFTGMFSFILFDRKNRQLFCGRDPFGMKPLYWTRTDAMIGFASEIPALLDIPGVKRDLDVASAWIYMSNGQTDAGYRTMFAHIRQVPAGSWMKISLDAPSDVRTGNYWQPKIAIREQSIEQSAKELGEMFLESIRLHLRSDMPVGIALSGGLDSSAIACCARTILGAKAEIQTFSFSAAGSDVDETPYIRIAADHASAETHVTQVDRKQFSADIDRIIAAQAEPFGGLSIYAQYRVMQIASANGIKVILDGQGADELFGGYRPFIARRMSELLARGNMSDLGALIKAVMALPDNRAALVVQALEPLVPASLQKQLRATIGRPMSPSWVEEAWFGARTCDSRSRTHRIGPHMLHEALAESLTATVLPALLRYEDRNSMAFSIESRLPFLTTKLADFAYALPSEHLIDRNGVSKSVLRRAMRGIVPDPILDRRDKIGFAAPDQLWSDFLRPWLQDIFSSDVARAIPFLRTDKILVDLERRFAGTMPLGAVWRAANFVRWIQRFNVRVENV